MCKSDIKTMWPIVFFHPKKTKKKKQTNREAIFICKQLCVCVRELMFIQSFCFRLHIRFYTHHFHSSCSSLALTANLSFSPSPDLIPLFPSFWHQHLPLVSLNCLRLCMRVSGLVCRETTDLIHPWKGIPDFENTLCRDASTTLR